MTIESAIAGLLILNLFVDAFLIYRHFNAKKPPPRLDESALDLLHDLTRRGAAILKVEVIDPAGLMIRSPRS